MKQLKILYKAICASSLICLIWSCTRNTHIQQNLDASIYTLCLQDILKESLIRSNAGVKELFLTSKLNSNYGIPSELYLNDNVVVKDLVNEDSTWKDFIKQMDIQSILNDTSTQQSDFTLGENFIISNDIKIISLAPNDSISLNPESFWLSHRNKFPNSIGIVTLSRILYSADKRKAMLFIERLTGRLSGVRMLYLVNVKPTIQIKFKRELEVM